jgi:gliding motility-associated-like protein
LGIGTDIVVSKFSEFIFDSGYNVQFNADGLPEMRGRDGNDFFSDSDNNGISLLDGEWHHLVGIVDKSVWKIYVDANLVGSFDNGHSFVNLGGSTNNLTFGRRSSNSLVLPPQFYKGQMDDILIYNRAISEEEIQTLFKIDCNAEKETIVEYQGCINDGFEIEVNDVTYNEDNPVGLETISIGQCSDSLIQVNLDFQEVFSETISYNGCQGDGFQVVVNSILYDESNPVGQEFFISETACDSLVNINLNFQTQSVDSINYLGCSRDGFEIIVNSNLYNESVPQGLEELVNQNGCDSIIIINLLFEDINICSEATEVKLPNIFTPGSSENNIFKIRAPDFVEIINLQIYDRWGNKVYDNDNPEQEWDGTINGNPAPSEVYIYTVTYLIPGNSPVTASRDLTLLR